MINRQSVSRMCLQVRLKIRAAARSDQGGGGCLRVTVSEISARDQSREADVQKARQVGRTATRSLTPFAPTSNCSQQRQVTAEDRKVRVILATFGATRQ